MGLRRKVASIAAGTALLSGQSLQAADAVFLGDCERAKIIEQQSTIDKLLPHQRYEGVGRIVLGPEQTYPCKSEHLLSITLTQRSRNERSIVFDISKQTIWNTRKPGCKVPGATESPAIYDTQTGTVVFESRFGQVGELCELYIWSNWDMTQDGPDQRKVTFANRVISLDGGGFTVIQPAVYNNWTYTPQSFSGAKP
jgi:hypothetical protein